MRTRPDISHQQLCHIPKASCNLKLHGCLLVRNMGDKLEQP